jgi:4-hydroxy-4-methyl-2-oxoglutarate aldolase
VPDFESLDTCAVSDAVDALGLDGALLEGIAAAWPGARAFGWAITMRLEPGPAPAGVPHLGVRAIERGSPGTVIVVDNGGRTDAACWGGLLSGAARSAGVRGVVANGAARDVDEARELGFSLFSVGTTCRTARGRYHEAACGEPVAFAGVTIETGDFIAADGSAVLVVKRADADAVLAKARELAAREAALRKALDSGEPPARVLGGNYEKMLGD